MGFDLSKNDLSKLSEVGYEFELTLPEVRTPTGAFVTVRGVNSPSVKAFGRKKFAEMQMQEQIAKRKGREVEPMTIEDAEDLATETALIRLITWKGIEEDGKELKFSAESAKRILKEHSWIREQILSESDNLSNFLM